MIDNETLHEKFVFINVFSAEISSHDMQTSVDWKNAYFNFHWFEDIYRFLITKNSIMKDNVKIHIFAKTLEYRIDSHFLVLWKNHRAIYLSCILESMIIVVLRRTHDEDEHYQKKRTLVKFRRQIYWSSLSTDVERYIRDCLKCARHDSAHRSQLLHSVRIEHSFQLLRFDFIDSLSMSIDTDDFYIFHVIDYFSRFFIIFSSKTANASDVLSALQRIFTLYVTSKVIYCDREHHFNNQNVIRFLELHEISHSFSFFDSSQSIDMIKMKNRLLKDIFRKSESQNWQNVLDQATKNLNNRIIRHLSASFIMILMRIFSSNVIVDTIFQVFASIISVWISQLTNLFAHENAIRRF
jgi:hypothetical protein